MEELNKLIESMHRVIKQFPKVRAELKGFNHQGNLNRAFNDALNSQMTIIRLRDCVDYYDTPPGD